MTGSVIEIERLPLTFLTAAAPERVELVWRRARDALVRSLPGELAAACGDALDADDAYVFIDRLEVGCAVRADGGEDAVASSFASALAREMLRAKDEGALVFRDRAEYLSAYLLAVVDGTAAGRWCFDEFDGLAPVPASAAIRTLLTLEPEAGWVALARLTPQSLARVVTSIEPADSDRLLADLPERPAGPTDRALLEALARVSGETLAPTQRAIVALAGVAGEGMGPPSAANARLLLALTALRARGRPMESPVTSDGLRAWCRAAGLDLYVTAELLRLDPQLVADFLGDADAGEGSRPAGRDGGSLFTPNGGAVMLLAVLARSGRWHAWRTTLEHAGAGDRTDVLAGWLALAVVARALCPTHPRLVEDDRLVRRVAGVPDDGRRMPRDRVAAAMIGRVVGASTEEVGAGRASGTPANWLRRAAVDLLVAFARTVPGCEDSSPAYLRRQALALPAAVEADGSEVRLGRAPLDVLLSMAGLKRTDVILPDGRRLVLTPELVP